MAAIVGEDLPSLRGALAACYGKDGNFTVIVEERSGDVAESSKESDATAQRKKRKRSDMPDSAEDAEATVQRTEFKVWSSLLAQWSPVFEKMMGSDSYTESQKSQVVIQDFSASAVDKFLRFPYTGSVQGSASALMEVAALADKYQVKALHELCMRLVEEALTAVTACEIFASADRFRMEDLRAEALDLIYLEPAKALKERPALRLELLEEILGSGVLCIQADALKEILRSWGGQDGESLESKINIRTNNKHTSDALHSLWNRYRQAGKKGPFVGGWVVMTLSREQREAYTTEVLESIASNETKPGTTWGPLTLRQGWVQWLLPHDSVHVQGFCLDIEISASTSFRIWCSEDGATWHLAYESHLKEIEESTFLEPKRPPRPVKSFKLEVLEGELDNVYFSIHGILQTPI